MSCVRLQIGQLKQRIDSEFKLGDAASQKLIHSGKILKDDQTIAGAKIQESDFLVVMVAAAKVSLSLSHPLSRSLPLPAADHHRKRLLYTLTADGICFFCSHQGRRNLPRQPQRSPSHPSQQLRLLRRRCHQALRLLRPPPRSLQPPHPRNPRLQNRSPVCRSARSAIALSHIDSLADLPSF